MANRNKMDQQQMLEAIEEAVRRKQEGEDPMISPSPRRLPQVTPQAWNIPVAPEKPAPEADVRKLMQERMKNRINPETGMPFFSAQDEEVPAEDPEIQRQRELRMKVLQQASETGQMPGYLKKL